MSTRIQLSAILILSGAMLALLPLPGKLTFRNSPSGVVETVSGKEALLSPDQVAKLIVSEDPGFILIDVRPEQDFRQVSIPGALGIPYSSMSDKDLGTFLPPDPVLKIFYSNGERDAGFAAALAAVYGHRSVAVMEEGLNGWFEDIMESNFSGDRITARENALFETRFRARRLFTEINSLPDSLKAKMLASKKFDPKKLDGGCE